MDEDLHLVVDGGTIGAEAGCGVAYCPFQNVLVVSCWDVKYKRERRSIGAIYVYSFDDKDGTFTLQRIISTAQLHSPVLPGRVLGFHKGDLLGGFLAFMGPPHARRLVMTEPADGAVGLMDVVKGLRAGYVAAPGTMQFARGVAGTECGTLVAVSARGSCPCICIFCKADIGWEKVHVIEVSMRSITGLSFVPAPPPESTSNGNTQKQLLLVSRDTGICAMDVEGNVVGWGCMSDGTMVMAHYFLHDVDDGDVRDSKPLSLACVPFFGVVFRFMNELQLVTTREVAAMMRMSRIRLAWMGAVVRSGFG